MLIQCTWYPHSGATHSLTKGEILRSALTTSQYMKLSEYKDLPLPPEVLDLMPQPKQLHLITQPRIGDFLARQNRITKAILGTEIAFFVRYLKYYTTHKTNMERYDAKLLNMWQTTLTYLLHWSLDKVQLNNISTPGVWATQVEIQAATEVYGVPLYLYTLKPSTTSYHWHCYSPRIRSQQYTVERINHIELAHPQQVHFEVVLDATTLPHPSEIDRHTTVHPTVL